MSLNKACLHYDMHKLYRPLAILFSVWSSERSGGLSAETRWLLGIIS